MSDYTKYVGIIAGIFTAASLLPQLVKIIRSKKAEDLSWFMFIILLVGLCGWVWYGILKNDWPIIATNSFSIIINLLILAYSLKYKRS